MSTRKGWSSPHLKTCKSSKRAKVNSGGNINFFISTSSCKVRNTSMKSVCCLSLRSHIVQYWLFPAQSCVKICTWLGPQAFWQWPVSIYFSPSRQHMFSKAFKMCTYQRGRWERGSGWGTHVNPWLIHFNVWQNPLQYCKVISLQLIKKN